MKKSIIFILFAAVIITACSGYFNDQTDLAKNGALNLALSDGSGYLSSDDYNEITPFLYRDGGRAWLFFASDRPGGSGGYDIYYAGMNADGKFETPVKMNPYVNSISNEFSPIVFRAYNGYNATNYLYISFIRYLNSQTNVVTYQFTNYPAAFDTATFPVHSLTGTNACHLALSGSSLNPTLELSYGKTNWLGIIWFTATMPEGWYGTTSNKNTGSTLLQAYSVSSALALPYGTNYLCSALVSGKYQFYLISSFSASLPSYINNISDYASDFNDNYPFVDASDNYKVYFASDRYGKGNFDLYRYNNKTFEKLVYTQVINSLTGYTPQITNMGPGAGTMGDINIKWTAVPLAAYYQIVISTNSNLSLPSRITNVAGLSLLYSGFISAQLYYAQIKAVNNGIESQWSTNAQGNANP